MWISSGGAIGRPVMPIKVYVHIMWTNYCEALNGRPSCREISAWWLISPWYCSKRQKHINISGTVLQRCYISNYWSHLHPSLIHISKWKISMVQYVTSSIHMPLQLFLTYSSSLPPPTDQYLLPQHRIAKGYRNRWRKASPKLLRAPHGPRDWRRCHRRWIRRICHAHHRR